MPGNNVTLTPNYNVVLDYGIAVGSENTTPTRVTSKNYQDILGNGVLSYDPTTQTLKSDGRIKRSSLKINAPGKDINLDGKDQIAVAAKLIVENAHNVKVNSNELAAIMARDDTSTIDLHRRGGYQRRIHGRERKPEYYKFQQSKHLYKLCSCGELRCDYHQQG